MDKRKVAASLLRLAKTLVSGEKAIATNESNWSWEYDSNYRTATVYVNESNGALRLEITELRRKTGLGSGEWRTVLEDVKIGTLSKPKLGPVRSLLKKHAHERTRAGRGFSRKWKAAYGGEDTLGNIVAEYAAAMGSPAMSDDDKLALIKEKLERMPTRDLDKMMGLLGLV